MAGEVNAHQTNTEMTRSPSVEIDAGSEVLLEVKVSCPSSCDLRGKLVRVVAHDSVVTGEVELSHFEEGTNETGEFTATAPIEPGSYTWSVVFPAQEVEGVLHDESSTPFSFTVKPHSTSIAVWDVPSPIGIGERFQIRVGVKCSAECNLLDKEIRIHGQGGEKVATGALGGVPWRSTSALYWTELELEAPSTEGYYEWSVEFPEPELELPHDGASYSFAFTTAEPPEHVVTVEIVDAQTQAPLKNAIVALQSGGTPWRGTADEAGVARVCVPKGGYDLYVLANAYKVFHATADVAGEVKVKAELTPRSRGNQ